MASQLAQVGYLRLPQILGNPKSEPPIQPIIPVSRSTWWQWVKDGKAPAGKKLGPRITAWKAEDIAELLNKLGQ